MLQEIVVSFCTLVLTIILIPKQKVYLLVCLVLKQVNCGARLDQVIEVFGVSVICVHRLLVGGKAHVFSP